jgi:hypothetical protein
MKLSELLERIEEERDNHGPDWDPDISVAVQPNYPMKCSLVGCLVSSELDGNPESGLEELPNDDEFWIVTTGHEEYTASPEMWNVAR